MKIGSRATVLAAVLVAAGCKGAPPPKAAAPPSADAPFAAVANEYLEDLYRRQPTQATYLGIHKYDGTLEDVVSERGALESVLHCARFTTKDRPDVREVVAT